MRREDLQADLYHHLRAEARRLMGNERSDHTLAATALVHEAYLRLGNSFENRAHFFAAAAQAMRRVLVDNARSHKRLKRGGHLERGELDVDQIPAPEEDDGLLALDAALDRLAQRDAVAARVVELHHFAALSHEHVAEALSITVYEARRLWTFARAWLKKEMPEYSSTDQEKGDA